MRTALVMVMALVLAVRGVLAAPHERFHQHLLTSTKLSIGEIATRVGFYDQSHLVRHMQRLRGKIRICTKSHPGTQAISGFGCEGKARR